ncbi:hypothetical protein ZIOFF_015543 [Zingiber officinale]|uniref:Uncharacterized protein n=1 Tax=Zingiber officinale TaxID=94328 RepID=A0A8J5HIR0_ZINOF|nr:hypothetical protein ZIOFF_015543 [Zingiber officinale]
MEKSKRIGDEEAEAQRPKPEVTDEEVDEFFTILRRVHAISKTFARKGSGTMAGAEETNTKATKRKKPARRRADVEGRKATSRWRPTFILEDFRVAGDADAAASSETAVATDLILDLDSEAVSEDVRTKIDVHAGTLSMEFGDTVVKFNIMEAMKYPVEDHSFLGINVIEERHGEDIQDWLFGPIYPIQYEDDIEASG